MSINSELAVLGAIMLKPESFWQVADILSESDFTTLDSQELFATYREMMGDSKPIDPWTVNGFNSKLKLDVLLELMSNSTGPANIRAYAESVLKSSELRKLALAGARIAKCSGFAEAQTLLAEIRPKANSKAATMKQAGKEFYDILCERYESNKPLGVSTGLENLDELVNGFRGGQLIVLAGRPNAGKTVWAVQYMIGAGRMFFASLEMPRYELIERTVSHLGNIPYHWLRNPKQAEEMFDGRLLNTLTKSNALPSVLDDTPMTVEDICIRARQHHMAEKLDGIIIDHLGLVGRPHKNDVSELGIITKQLKILAKELDVPVVLLCQLNRKSTDRADGEPKTQDLRDSGRIEEDADIVILMHKLPDNETIKFIVGKNRSGATGAVWATARYSTMHLYPSQEPVTQESANVRKFTR